MQAVILCAGKSTRTYPFTLTKPKPLLKVLDKTIIEHNLDVLVSVGGVTEVIVVVGYKAEMIKEKIGEEYKGLSIKYVEQKEQNGTGGALLCCKEALVGKFLLMYGDDLYSEKDVKKLVSCECGVLVQEVSDPEKWGIIEEKNGVAVGIEEKPDAPKSNLGNTGCYVLDVTVFDHELKESVRGELEATDYISWLISSGQEVSVVRVENYWLPVGYPWHLLEANVEMLRRIESGKVEGVVEEGVVMKGVVVIGEGTLVKSGTYIEGPVFIGKNCEVGPNAFIRKDTILMDGVRVRGEIVDAVLMDNCTSKHESYIGHSVIGERVNIGAGTVTSDYRHDGGNHMTLIGGKKIDSGRRKLGAFLGDDVKTGIGTLIYPGRKIWAGGTTLPGEIVKEDKIVE